MSSYDEYAKAFDDAEREAREERYNVLTARANDLSRHIGPGLWPKTRQELEELSRCESRDAASTARVALIQQREYDHPPAPFEPLNWDEDS